MGIFSTIGDIIGIGGGLFEAFRKEDEPQGFAGMQRSAQFRDDITRALTQPDFGQFSNLLSAEEGNINRNTAEGLKALSVASQRQQARTGRGILSSARGDEAMSQISARMFSQAKDEARNRVRQYLQQAAGINNVQGFASVANVSSNLIASRTENRRGGLESISKGLGVLDKTFPDFGKNAFSGLLTGNPSQTQAGSR